MNPERDNIGAVIGTACHAGPEAIWKARLEGRPEPDAIEVALANFRKSWNKFVGMDAETRDEKIAEKQIRRMVFEYLPFAQALPVTYVEFAMSLHYDGRYWTTGHCDVYNGDIRDEKYGKSANGYEIQFGTYSLQAISLGLPVRQLWMDHTPRHSLTSPQKKTRFIEINKNVAETAAWRTIDTVAGMTEKYIETGDPWSFPANNHSDLCAKKWCRAHSTPYCTLGRNNVTE
jgi:hypothetical protein